MVVVKLMGGLGNQMFQYAVARSLSIENNTELKLDISFLLDRSPRPNFVFRDYDLGVFNIKARIAEASEVDIITRKSLLEKVMVKAGIRETKLYREKYFHFDPQVMRLKPPIYLEGYWQSYLYFQNIADVIRKEFTLKDIIPYSIQQMAHKIRICNESVCLNVRRGDFVSNPESKRVHGVCDKNYYDRALAYLCRFLKKPNIFVFSDDIEWCQSQFKYDFPITFMMHEEFAGPKFSHYFYLMTQCHHFIIPNSTFAFWAAWYPENQNKIVVAPKNWFNNYSANTNNLIPASWIRI